MKPHCRFCQYHNPQDRLWDATYRGQPIKVCKEHKSYATNVIETRDVPEVIHQPTASQGSLFGDCA